MQVDLRLSFDKATISFNGVPHLIFTISKFVGLQTWRCSDRYVLELTLAGGVITLEYDTLEKLTTVLAKIEQALDYP
jgi:hypothetical protein